MLLCCYLTACSENDNDGSGSHSVDDGELVSDGGADSAGDMNAIVDIAMDVLDSDQKNVDNIPVKPETYEIIEIGTVEFQAPGLSPEFTLDVTDSATSVTLMVIGYPGNIYTLDRLKIDDEKYLVPPAWYASNEGGVCWFGCTFRVTFAEQTYAVTVPNTPLIDHKGGLYTFRFFGVDTSTRGTPRGPAHVRAIIKKASPPPGPAKVDVHFYFTGAGGYSAGSAPNSPEFIWAVEDMRNKLETGGVTLGKLTYTNVDPDLAVVETSSGPGSDLGQLFAHSQQSGREGIHIFFVDELLQTGGGWGGSGLVLGISGGIPGPPLTTGTFSSGIAVLANKWYLSQLGGILGGTMAHETGHYLGLYHSTESSGAGDNIPDTELGDENNLMHWTSNAKGLKLSWGQGVVIQRNPMVVMDDTTDANQGK
ncbi:MAG: hypothetical protein HUU55_20985 [Myxococcales bacterium]|nr:hypothetical protein [Myxococcales bacterium]